MLPRPHSRRHTRDTRPVPRPRNARPPKAGSTGVRGPRAADRAPRATPAPVERHARRATRHPACETRRAQARMATTPRSRSPRQRSTRHCAGRRSARATFRVCRRGARLRASPSSRRCPSPSARTRARARSPCFAAMGRARAAPHCHRATTTGSQTSRRSSTESRPSLSPAPQAWRHPRNARATASCPRVAGSRAARPLPLRASPRVRRCGSHRPRCAPASRRQPPVLRDGPQPAQHPRRPRATHRARAPHARRPRHRAPASSPARARAARAPSRPPPSPPTCLPDRSVQPGSRRWPCSQPAGQRAPGWRSMRAPAHPARRAPGPWRGTARAAGTRVRTPWEHKLQRHRIHA